MTQLFVDMKLFSLFKSPDKEKFNLVEISDKLSDTNSSAFYTVKVDANTKRIFEVSK